MAKVAHGWAPLLAVVLPAAWVAAVGAAALAGEAGSPVVRGAGEWMARDTAVALVLAGVAALAGAGDSRAARRLRHGCALLLGILALFDAARIALGIEASGRMSPPTVLAMDITTALLLLYDRPRNRLHALGVQLLIGVLLSIGIVSLIAQGVRNEGLLEWYRWSRMPFMAAGAVVALGAALLALVARSPWYHALYSQHEDEKLVVLVLGILLLVAIAMGAAATVAMQKNLERTLQGSLASAVDDRALILDNLVAGRVTRVAIVATRPGVIDALDAAVRDGGSRSRERLRREADSIVDAGFSAVVLVDPAGQPLAAAGDLVESPTLEIPLEGMRAPSTLLFRDQYLLRVRMPVVAGNRVVGGMIVEQTLELLPRLQLEQPEIGVSAQWLLCGALDEARMACFPDRYTPRARIELRRAAPGFQPMDIALAGGAGVAYANDSRGERVVAGYAPAGRSGLGVILQVETDDFYEPLRRDLDLWWRWYFAFALAAMLLVASQVRPIAQRLVQSERTARERSEELARSDAAFRELYASLADGIIVITPEGLIDFANPAVAAMFGYTVTELVGQPVSMLIAEELRGSNARATERFLRDGPSNVLGAGTLVYPAVRRDGTRFDIEFSLAAMRQGDAQRLVAVVRDVTQRTALERMKNEFTATVSHELRTPLTSVMGSLELLREEPALEGPAREMLDMAWRNSQRLALLVNDVIDAERIESGAMKFEPTRFALRDFLEEAVRLDQPYAAKHDATLRLAEPLPEAFVRADRGRLLQVMANLVSNAAKFSPAGGEVAVSAAARGNRVRIQVSDRGRGIPEDFRPRIFQRFAQADSSDERERGGTGLGLAICKAIVERSGGTIGFEDREGGGTTFWFELPDG